MGEFGVGLTDADLFGKFTPGIALSIGGAVLDVAGNAGPVALTHSDGITLTGEEDVAAVSKEDGGDV